MQKNIKRTTMFQNPSSPALVYRRHVRLVQSDSPFNGSTASTAGKASPGWHVVSKWLVNKYRLNAHQQGQRVGRYVVGRDRSAAGISQIRIVLPLEHGFGKSPVRLSHLDHGRIVGVLNSGSRKGKWIIDLNTCAI